MNKPGTHRLLVVIVTLALAGGAFFVGYQNGLQAHPPIEAVTLDNKEFGKPDNVDFSTFWKAWNVLNDRYVTTVHSTSTSDQEKVWGAIQGLASSYKDPYTVFFTPEENEIFQSAISGSFEGIGMEIALRENTITVVAPLKDTPAYRAGIKPGDLVLKIDGLVTSGFSVEKAVKMIRGKKGTIVTLTLSREGKGEPFEIKVERDTIKIPALDVEGKDSTGKTVAKGTDSKPIGLRDDGIFVIRLYNFSADSAELFRSALRRFIESGSHKLVIDVRGNPGGYLEAAVDMASWFLPPGKLIVKEDFGTKQPPDEFRSRGYGKEKFGVFTDELKVVVLVDGGSASASEILAGALSENGVAKLIGTKTFGKGSVQELVNITSDTTLKVTIARWLTPNGTSISEKGIDPDIEVKITEEDVKNKRDPQMDKAVEYLNTLQ